MKKEAKKLIESYIKTLKNGITDQVTYEHVMASILEIHTKGLQFSAVLEQLIEEVDGLIENVEIFNSLSLLAESIDCYNREILDMYKEEIVQDRDKWEFAITGEIYDFICDNFER